MLCEWSSILTCYCSVSLLEKRLLKTLSSIYLSQDLICFTLRLFALHSFFPSCHCRLSTKAQAGYQMALEVRGKLAEADMRGRQIAQAAQVAEQAAVAATRSSAEVRLPSVSMLLEYQ